MRKLIFLPIENGTFNIDLATQTLPIESSDPSDTQLKTENFFVF